MKLTKKVLALILSVAMILAMSVTVFATDITITGGDTGSEYAAYKLLDLTTSKNGTKTNYSYTLNDKFRTILYTVTSKDSDEDVVDYISKLNEADTRNFADSVYSQINSSNPKILADYTTNNDKFENVAQGYYLITETKIGTVGNPAQTGSLSLVMLNTAGQDNIDVVTKESVPTVVKKVKDVNDSTGDVTGWQDSADADINDELNYKLTGTVSAKIADYKKYYYEFADEMTKLTYVENSVKVTIGNDNETDTSNKDVTDQFTTKWNSQTKTLRVYCNDLKALTDENNGIISINAETKVVVTYKATLDEGAYIGATGNPNEVKLIYSNNPYDTGNGEPSKGETPVDKNIVFTYKVTANKTDGEKPLKGAAFQLYKKVKDETPDGTWESLGVVGATKNNEGKYVANSDQPTSFSWTGLDDGVYKLVEVLTPDGYNSISDQIFEVTATHDEIADSPELKTLSGDRKNGEISFTTVKENNKITGELLTNVVNKSGSLLPSTGGIGTTIFYIVGVVLVLGAGVLLVTKKRMNADK